MTGSISAGQLGVVLTRLRRRFLDVRPEDGQLGVARERRLPGEAFVEHAAERVLVGAAVDVAAFDLLGRGIGRRADARASSSGRPSGSARRLRQPEVGQVDVLVLVEQHVRRLDVAVDEPAGVGRVERGGDLAADRDRTFRVEDALPSAATA